MNNPQTVRESMITLTHLVVSDWVRSHQNLGIVKEVTEEFCGSSKQYRPSHLILMFLGPPSGEHWATVHGRAASRKTLPPRKEHHCPSAVGEIFVDGCQVFVSFSYWRLKLLYKHKGCSLTMYIFTQHVSLFSLHHCTYTCLIHNSW